MIILFYRNKYIRILAVLTILALLLCTADHRGDGSVFAAELQDSVEEQTSYRIDFVKINERLTKGNLKIPGRFQKKILLYWTIMDAVDRYVSETGIEDIFSCDLERDIMLENTIFRLRSISSKEEVECYEYSAVYPAEENETGEKRFQLKLSGREHVLYVDVDLENRKVFLYPEEYFTSDRTSDNPEAYAKIRIAEEGGVAYYPDMYVESDWDDLEQIDNYIAGVTWEEIEERKLDYLVLPEEFYGYSALYISVASVLKRYMEENQIEDVFSFDADEDIICRETNMIFTCRLRGRNRTLYMDFDGYNMKAHIYEVEE